MAKVSFVTLGCRLNQAEEERLRRQFMNAGYMVCEPGVADLVIVNTCSVTALADKKSRQTIRKIKAQNPKIKIVVTGCGSSEAQDLPEVDLVIPNAKKDKGFEIILGKLQKTNIKIQTNLNNQKASKLRIENCVSGRTRALMKVQDGCNNFCAYCIVPYLRGREVSLLAEDLVLEAIKLDKAGYKELVISGVNVGKYGASRGQNTKTKSKILYPKVDNLYELLKLILKETNFPRIRLSSINPQDITDDLVGLWSSEPRLCRHFHLSLQSGSDTVLQRMGRPYDTKMYLEVVRKLATAMPEVAITTDVIVGFPGESDAEFKETLRFVEKAGFAKLHVFPYSIRKGTRAAEMPDQVDSETKKLRAKKLRDLGDRLRRDYLNRFSGVGAEVLFEGNKYGYWYGLTSNYIRVKYKSDEDLENKIKKIGLTKSNMIIN